MCLLHASEQSLDAVWTVRRLLRAMMQFVSWMFSCRRLRDNIRDESGPNMHGVGRASSRRHELIAWTTHKTCRPKS